MEKKKNLQRNIMKNRASGPGGVALCPPLSILMANATATRHTALPLLLLLLMLLCQGGGYRPIFIGNHTCCCWYRLIWWRRQNFQAPLQGDPPVVHLLQVSDLVTSNTRVQPLALRRNVVLNPKPLTHRISKLWKKAKSPFLPSPLTYIYIYIYIKKNWRADGLELTMSAPSRTIVTEGNC